MRGGVGPTGAIHRDERAPQMVGDKALHRARRSHYSSWTERPRQGDHDRVSEEWALRAYQAVGGEGTGDSCIGIATGYAAAEQGHGKCHPCGGSSQNAGNPGSCHWAIPDSVPMTLAAKSNAREGEKTSGRPPPAPRCVSENHPRG